jgi:hypothetical protein
VDDEGPQKAEAEGHLEKIRRAQVEFPWKFSVTPRDGRGDHGWLGLGVPRASVLSNVIKLMKLPSNPLRTSSPKQGTQ